MAPFLSAIYLCRIFRALGQKSPHVVFESLHVHFLCCFSIINLNLVDLRAETKVVNQSNSCLVNTSSTQAFEQKGATSQEPRGTRGTTGTKAVRYSPGGARVPDRPPRRSRGPLDLARAAVYCHPMAAYRLNRQTLRPHHHCRLPAREDGQSHAEVWEMRLVTFLVNDYSASFVL